MFTLPVRPALATLAACLSLVALMLSSTRPGSTQGEEHSRFELVGYNPSCGNGSILATNTGSIVSRPIILTLAPETDEPTRAECGTDITAGRSVLFPRIVPLGGGRLVGYSFTTQTMGAVGAEPASDEPVADWVCETLFFTVIQNAPAFIAFDEAYRRGTDWNGLPMAKAYGDSVTFVAPPSRACIVFLPFEYRYVRQRNQ